MRKNVSAMIMQVIKQWVMRINRQVVAIVIQFWMILMVKVCSLFNSQRELLDEIKLMILLNTEQLLNFCVSCIYHCYLVNLLSSKLLATLVF